MKTLDIISSTGVTRSKDNDVALYYLVNYEGGGFAILSSDSRLKPIYAISEEGSLLPEDTSMI